MCTSTCPCPPATTSNWYSIYLNSTFTVQNYTFNAETYAHVFNRTLSTVTTSTTLTPFKLGTSKNGTYDNFWDCYTYMKGIDAAQAQLNSTYKSKVVSISDGFQNFATNVESALNCNGICYPGLFYYFKTLYTGPPQKNCVDGLTSIFGSKPLGIGILLLISFVLTVFTHITTWSICCHCCAPKETKEKWNNSHK